MRINRTQCGMQALPTRWIKIVDLVSQGVDGIHLYTMNNPYVAKRISESVRTLF